MMKINRATGALAAGLAGLGTIGAADAQVLTNGGFETPATPASPGYSTYPNGSTAVNGWTVTSGDINTVSGTFGSSNGNLAREGKQYIDLIGESGAGSLAQSFATTADKRYKLSFSYSHNLFSVGSASFDYALTNATGDIAGSFTHNTGSSANLDWQDVSFLFHATGGSSSLSFVNTAGNGTGGAFLDAVSISAVPEPAAWGMMIVGFGVVGGALRRRRTLAIA